MNLFSLPNFTVGLYSLFLGIFILTSNPKSILNRLLFIFCTLITFWLVSYGIVYSCSTVDNAIFFSKLGHIPVLFYAPVFYYICILLTKRPLKKEIKYIIIASIANVILLSFLFSTNLYIATVKRYFWGYYPTAGILLPIEIAITVLIVTRGSYLLYITYRYNPNKLPKAELNKLKYFTLAFAIYMLSCCDFMQKYGIETYPLGFVFSIIFLYIISYAILRHKLLDINIIFRKGLIYSVLLSIISVLYFALAFLSENIFRKAVGYSSPGLTLAIIIFFILIFQPLKNNIQRIIDKYLFHGSIDQIDEENIKLRDELQKSEKLKAVATLAAGMAHEIKNPLTSIKTFTEYMPQKGADPAFRDKFQDIVGTEVDRINHIVKQLLEFSKSSELELKKTDINELLDDTLHLLSNDFLKHNIKIEKQYSTLPQTNVDPHQMKQVFLNLFLNAKDAMKNGGTLTITTEHSDNKF